METIIGMLNVNRKHEREAARRQLEEQIRHNRAIESIENKKARVSVYDSIEKSVSLFLSSQKVYDQVKGTMSLEQIAQALPNCIKCFDFASMTEHDRIKFSKQYNDWAIANELTDRIDPDFFN